MCVVVLATTVIRSVLVNRTRHFCLILFAKVDLTLSIPVTVRLASLLVALYLLTDTCTKCQCFLLRKVGLFIDGGGGGGDESLE